MARCVTDEEIQSFLTRHGAKHESQIGLIESALRFLWPEGPPGDAAERVVLLALASPNVALRERDLRAASL